MRECRPERPVLGQQLKGGHDDGHGVVVLAPAVIVVVADLSAPPAAPAVGGQVRHRLLPACQRGRSGVGDDQRDGRVSGAGVVGPGAAPPVHHAVGRILAGAGRIVVADLGAKQLAVGGELRGHPLRRHGRAVDLHHQHRHPAVLRGTRRAAGRAYLADRLRPPCPPVSATRHRSAPPSPRSRTPSTSPRTGPAPRDASPPTSTSAPPAGSAASPASSAKPRSPRSSTAPRRSPRHRWMRSPSTTSPSSTTDPPTRPVGRAPGPGAKVTALPDWAASPTLPAPVPQHPGCAAPAGGEHRFLAHPPRPGPPPAHALPPGRPEHHHHRPPQPVPPEDPKSISTTRRGTTSPHSPASPTTTSSTPCPA